MRYTTAFLDRDRTLTADLPEGEYITSVEQIELIDGVGDALRKLNDAGIFTVVVSNQRAIALGLLAEDDHVCITDSFERQLAEYGAYIDWHYYCPHDTNVCDCRKPRPGMLLRAFDEHPELQIDHSVIVGDRPSDIEAGAAVGITTILVDPTNKWPRVHPDLRVNSFAEAVEWILAENKAFIGAF